MYHWLLRYPVRVALLYCRYREAARESVPRRQEFNWRSNAECQTWTRHNFNPLFTRGRGRRNREQEQDAWSASSFKMAQNLILPLTVPERVESNAMKQGQIAITVCHILANVQATQKKHLMALLNQEPSSLKIMFRLFTEPRHRGISRTTWNMVTISVFASF